MLTVAEPLAQLRTLCLDAVDPELLGRFWAAALGLTWRPDDRPPAEREGGVFGAAERPVLWLNRVSEPKRVKHRMHLDIDCERLTDLEALGASVVLAAGADRRWTVMADPEGGEFCAFLRSPTREPRLHGVVLDCADPMAQAAFWQRLLGGTLDDHGGAGWATIEDVFPGCTFDFVPVPEPKAAPNRIHLDVTAPAVGPLLDAGARVLRAPGAGSDLTWHVLADPEGNEFCAFSS